MSSSQNFVFHWLDAHLLILRYVSKDEAKNVCLHKIYKGEPPSISQTVNFANFVIFFIQIWGICLRIDKYVIICQAS